MLDNQSHSQATFHYDQDNTTIRIEMMLSCGVQPCQHRSPDDRGSTMHPRSTVAPSTVM